MSTPLPLLKTIRLFLACLALLPLTGLAQVPLPPDTAAKKALQYPLANQFEHLSIKDGLSSNSVFSILQDREGYMWFGTAEGLNRYDGHTFTIFKQDPDRPNHSFRNSIITSLCEGGHDAVWASTEGGGLHEVNKKTGRITPHPIVAPNANRWNNQISVYTDRQGIIWIGTFAGLARYEPSRRHFTLYPSPIPEVAIKTVFEDRQHRFWVASHQGLFLFDRASGRFTRVPVPGLMGLQPSFISFYQDNQNTLWLGTATAGYSLFRIDLNRQPWRLVPYNPTGQLNPYVWRNTLHQDKSGILWVGTSNGLQAIDPSTDRVVTYQTDANLAKGLGSNGAQAVYHDRSGAIWVGTDNGIDRQSVNTKPFQAYQIRPNEQMRTLIDNRANAVYKDGQGQLWFSNLTSVNRLSARGQLTTIPPRTLGTIGQHTNYVHTFLAEGPAATWIGTNDGLYHVDQRTGQYTAYPAEIPAQYVAVQSIRGKPVGDLWIGGEGGIASFNTRTHAYTYYKYQPGRTGGFLPDKYVYGLLVSQFGEVWVLIHQLGLCRLNVNTGQLNRYMAGAKGGLNTNDVLSIHEDRDGIIWIGTHMGGLNRFDWRTGLFSAITHQEGIPGSSVIGITSDAAGCLWLSTNAGLCRVDPRTRAIHSYDVADGLPSNDFKPNAVFRQPGLLVFGTENGIVQFDPSRINDDTHPFPVYITRLTVLDKPRALTDSVIQLDHDENRLSFGFAALAYEQPDQNQFAYQLVGVDPTWVPNENRQVATFTSLQPGTYTFRVKAANSNGFWTPNQASIRVIVRSPWWATWWAYVLYALLAAGAVWAYIRFYTSRLRQQQESAFNRREAEQLKTVDELKTRFFANITHEFRTPLSLIMSPVEKLLQEGRFDRSMLTLVYRNSEQLLRLINQLLDLSKLEANYMAIALRQGDVIDFVDHLVDVFQRAAEQKGVTFIYTAVPFPTHSYVFDADKWEKILTNLLSNALKFTPSGGQVSFSVSPSPSASEPTGVQILLADSGIGIAPDQLPHIFDRFYQADTSSTRAYEGTGIGLALAKELIDLLGGAIAVESTPAMGTTFRLTLPLQPVSAHADLPGIGWSIPTGREYLLAPAPLAVTLAPVTDEERTPRILVVEDNDELRAFLVGELTPAYRVFQAADGQEGWELTLAELPDIVLTDVMMPRRDGYELTRLIKDHTDTNHIAVVMLTAKAAQQSRIGGLQQGADDYLAKPFSIDELKLRLHNMVTRQQRLSDYYRQQFALLTAADLPIDPVVVNWIDSQNPFLRRIYEALDKHLDDPMISVDWLADQLAMNRKTLYRKIHSLIQLSPADLIRQYRLRKAADLLRAGNNVSETADRVGFNTPSHFAFVFKEFYHQTPSEFMHNQAKNSPDRPRPSTRRTS